MMLASAHLCKPARCPKALTPTPAVIPQQRWPQLWSKRSGAVNCHDRSGQRSEDPTPDDHDEPRQSIQQSQPWWACGSSGTSGADQPSAIHEPPTQHSSSGEAAAAPDPQLPALAAEPQVPWALSTTIALTTTLYLNIVAIDTAAVSLEYLLCPGPMTLRVYTVVLFLDALARLLLMAEFMRLIRLFSPPPLGSFPLSWKPLAEWDPPLALQVVAYVLILHTVPTVLKNMHGPLAGYHLKAAHEQDAWQVLGKGDLVADGLYLSVMCVFGPVWEELAFRGFLIPSLKRYLPAWGTVLISATAFAAVHRNPTLTQLLAGVVLGAAFLRARNLWPPILMHSAWNFWGFLMIDVLPRWFP